MIPNIPQNVKKLDHEMSILWGRNIIVIKKKDSIKLIKPNSMVRSIGVLWSLVLYGFFTVRCISIVSLLEGFHFLIGVVEEMLGILGTGSSIGMAVAFSLVGNNLYKFLLRRKFRK